MNDIKIEIKNYKLLKDFNGDYNNARVLLVTADNEKGKSSLIRAIIENMTAKATTPDPVSHGEQTGEKTITIPDKDGNMCVIHHNFSNDNRTGSFYAIDHLGRKVSTPVKIRELVGTFEELPIDTFYEMQKSAEGRRKIIKNYLYPLLKEKEIQEIQDIDRRTNTGGDEFERRASANSVVKHLQSTLKDSVPSEQDKLLAKEHENLTKYIQELDRDIIDASTIDLKRTAIQDNITQMQVQLDAIPAEVEDYNGELEATITELGEEIDEWEAEIKKLQDKIVKNKQQMQNARDSYSGFAIEVQQREDHLKREIEAKKEELKQYEGHFDLQKLKTEKEETQLILNQSIAASTKISSYKTAYDQVTAKQKEAMDLDATINNLRAKKIEILKSSSLPAGLSIDGDDFSFNGFTFTDTQVSKSSAMLVIAEILCNVVQSKIVYIGERALFNQERFNQLVHIAEKYGKIPVLEQVIDKQEDIKVITEISE